MHKATAETCRAPPGGSACVEPVRVVPPPNVVPTRLAGPQSFLEPPTEQLLGLDKRGAFRRALCVGWQLLTPTQGSTGSTTGTGSVPTSHMDSTITRLLIATKQLLEGTRRRDGARARARTPWVVAALLTLSRMLAGLAKWSREEVTDDAISAIYVKLGNDFNVACAAFAKENIGMRCAGGHGLGAAARWAVHGADTVFTAVSCSQSLQSSACA